VWISGAVAAFVPATAFPGHPEMVAAWFAGSLATAIVTGRLCGMTATVLNR
jgi:hypothetical protein